LATPVFGKKLPAISLFAKSHFYLPGFDWVYWEDAIKTLTRRMLRRMQWRMFHDASRLPETRVQTLPSADTESETQQQKTRRQQALLPNDYSQKTPTSKSQKKRLKVAV
jgi:hypothetical protein